MEAGSRWPAWLEAPPESRIVAQDPQESAEALTARTVRVIEALRARGKRLQTVVIAAGRDGEGDRALTARSEVARAALAALTPEAGVVLAGNDELPESVRHELFTTAEIMTQLFAGSAIDVSVRIDATDDAERHPISGLYPIVSFPASEADTRTGGIGAA
jgi:hypothetical protein